jgi:hypothetical protein
LTASTCARGGLPLRLAFEAGQELVPAFRRAMAELAAAAGRRDLALARLVAGEHAGPFREGPEIG